MKASRLESHVPSWWADVNEWAVKNGVSVDQADVLFELIYAAFEESGAKLLGSAGGRKGGKAAAAKLTADQRHARASHAARARWGLK